MKQNTSESGRSMVEMLGVIAIIGVISIGGITSMSYVDSYFRTSSTLLEVDRMAQDIINMCSWASSMDTCLGDDPTDTVKQEKILDSDKNRWGGEIRIRSRGDTFTIEFTNVPKSVCEQMQSETADAEGAHHLMRVITGNCTDNGTVIFEENQ